MGKDRFDFSEIDAALPAAERMQEKDRLTDALENNYRAVGILGDRVEKLESRLSEVLPGLDEAISSLGGASKITISAESRRVLEQEGEAICRKMAEGINKESARLLNHCLLYTSLHLESKSGIPHLHGAFCRIDEQGRINNDHDIHLRAQRAAERVAP